MWHGCPRCVIDKEQSAMGYGALPTLCSHHVHQPEIFFMRRLFILAGIAAGMLLGFFAGANA
jgi:hypothetical protein